MTHASKMASLTIVFTLLFGVYPAVCQSSGAQSTSSPLLTDSAGVNAKVALGSVFRVICPKLGTYGTGFLHKSGNVITANHVVDGCDAIVIALTDNSTITATLVAHSDHFDLAIIKPSKPISSTPLIIAPLSTTLTPGQQIQIWGFPAGYNGRLPMLSVGYVAGEDAILSKDQQWTVQLVLNAAVNHGNSGGPVTLVETGEVVGIADNKIVPISNDAIVALKALQNFKGGFTYPATLADGTTTSFSEAQVVAMVLSDLQQQVQLVVGRATLFGDLRQFLIDNKIDP